MTNEEDTADVQSRNWTLATGTKPGARHEHSPSMRQKPFVLGSLVIAMFAGTALPAMAQGKGVAVLDLIQNIGAVNAASLQAHTFCSEVRSSARPRSSIVDTSRR